MELVHAPSAPRAFSPSCDPGQADFAPTSQQSQLEELMAAANVAATIPASAGYAIWEDACRQLAAEQQSAPARVATAGPKTVLVVESTASIRELARKTLTNAGYLVVVAEDGVKGLAAARQHKADLVIADVEMPAMDGIALIGEMRGLAAHRKTPIMMLTTEAGEGKKVAGRRAGASGWISKPFDAQRFLAIVQHVCPNC